MSLNSNFTFIDLFAGMGGFHLASSYFGGTCVFASDIDTFAQKTYKHNFGLTPFGDIASINEIDIPNHDVLYAGFPCQPFSYSGKCEGFEDKTRGTLFFDVIRIIKAKNPKVILLENVKGFKSHRKGETMRIAIKCLESLDYIVDWAIINSMYHNVPQARERWYCLAIKSEFITPETAFPRLNGLPKSKAPKLKSILQEKSEIDFDYLSISPLESERIDYHFKNMEYREDRVRHDSSRYAEGTRKNKYGVYSYLKPDGSLRFHVGDKAKTNIQEAFYASINSVAPTITANRVPKILELRRKLSVREALRLQGYPEGYSFNVSNAQAYKQIGNSVTPKVVIDILQHININKLLSNP